MGAEHRRAVPHGKGEVLPPQPWDENKFKSFAAEIDEIRLKLEASMGEEDVRFPESNTNRMEPLKDDNTELLTKAYDAVLNSCPDLQAMANELDRALGATSGTGEGSTPGSTPAPTSSLTGSTTTRGTTGTGTTSTTTFNSMLRNDNTIFSVIGIGTVGDTQVKIKAVLDTSNSNANRWQTLYWRVE